MFEITIIFFIISLILIKICEKNLFLIDVKLEKHKRFTSKKNNYYLGGLIFLLFLITLYFFNIIQEPNFLVSIIFLFFIGLASDLRLLKNAKIRFILQLLAIIFFIEIEKFSIPLTNINLIDNFLSNLYFNKLFTIFCLMILINGFNFIDGVNTLLLGYNLITVFFLLFVFKENLHDIDLLKNYLIIILILLFFNLNGKIIMGDAGAYSLAFFLGVYLIKFADFNKSLSPFFVILILWYPCYELLFSIIRRLTSKKKTYEPDTLHLHQILFSFFKKKYSITMTHFFVSLTINTYLLLILFINKIINYKTTTLLIFIVVNITVYYLFYKLINKSK